ncbi:MAG TPA: hypothetical protein VJ299_02835, partial [Steroidobacteraceae bacterium]|nr:hypothetical protein [Steroidobacteraceae bacterium]
MEQYRRERQACSSELRVELARITDDIDDPVAKLRYLRAAIDRGDATPIAHVPCGPLRRVLYRFRGLEALDAVAGATIGARTLAARVRARRVAAGAFAASLLFVPALLVGLAVQREPVAVAKPLVAPPIVEP